VTVPEAVTHAVTQTAMTQTAVTQIMTQAEWERVAAIYLPLVAALVLGLIRGRRARQFPALLLSLLWTMVSLAALQRLNQVVGWWSFPVDDMRFCGMSLELYAGWALLWGILPQLAFPRLPLPFVAAIMTLLDLVAMPLCVDVVHLGPRWLIGEAVAVLFVLAPALCIARWTRLDTHLGLRCTLQVALAGMLVLFFIPEIAFALRPGRGWAPLLHMLGWRRQLLSQLVLLLSLPGINAVMEFAERGSGTPIPYDSPKRLVTSGIYRYCANPMQLSCGFVMLLWAAILSNGWLVLAAAMSLVYSAGIAEWDEQQDLASRFGADWVRYRASVRPWRLRWRPYHDGPAARLFMSMSCGPCSQLQRWLERRSPYTLEIADADALPHGSIRRMRYAPGDGTPAVDGVRALGWALEHLHLGWALAGCALRLPGVWQFVQMVMDASGLGPRLPAAKPAQDGCPGCL
jgi:protein-S-isoprenylcysteine O-methyltransferase Ste14